MPSSQHSAQHVKMLALIINKCFMNLIIVLYCWKVEMDLQIY